MISELRNIQLNLKNIFNSLVLKYDLYKYIHFKYTDQQSHVYSAQSPSQPWLRTLSSTRDAFSLLFFHYRSSLRAQQSWANILSCSVSLSSLVPLQFPPPFLISISACFACVIIAQHFPL